MLFRLGGFHYPVFQTAALFCIFWSAVDSLKGVFHLSYSILQLPVFFLFSPLLRFSLCSSILLLSSESIFMIITLNSFSGRSLNSLIYSFSKDLPYFIWNIFLYPLILPDSVYFYVSGWSVMSPGLEGVSLCRRCPVGPTRANCHGHPSQVP